MSSGYRRYMGIDYGTVRIGIAVSDPLKIIAQGFTTVPNDGDAIKRILAIVDEQDVERIIIGDPLTLRGEQSSKGEEVAVFVERLRTATPVTIDRADERFTSVMAQRSLVAMGTRKKQRQQNKGKIDEMAAAIMLQGYLDAKR
ncbi:MAG: Holliday junction resolvase RuvX [Bacteroidetes bacterium]|nr:Holliday junction resolvase RuvX [Bacteroidota bacterium]